MAIFHFLPLFLSNVNITRKSGKHEKRNRPKGKIGKNLFGQNFLAPWWNENGKLIGLHSLQILSFTSVDSNRIYLLAEIVNTHNGRGKESTTENFKWLRSTLLSRRTTVTKDRTFSFSFWTFMTTATTMSSFESLALDHRPAIHLLTIVVSSRTRHD